MESRCKIHDDINKILGKLLESYAQSMYHMLGSTTNKTLNEPKFLIPTPSDTQTFTIVPENFEFTYIDASNQLQREPYSDIKEKLMRHQVIDSRTGDIWIRSKEGILSRIKSNDKKES
ncbi:hypothetical protein PCK2_000604 [Pneumocystis canis]|nr:hypothetical protein PCK2_000604 [Pneumocystis canis]